MFTLSDFSFSPTERAAVENGWNDSMYSYTGAPLYFLTPEYLDDAIRSAELPIELSPLLKNYAAKLQADPKNRAFANHANRLFLHGTNNFRDWPGVGGDEGLFFLLLALSLIAPLREVYRAQGIPDEYLACANRINGYYNTYLAGFGKPGLNKTQVYWLRHYLNLRCFRIGRLEFMISHAREYNIQAYKERKTGRIQALAGERFMRYDSDGMPLFASEDDTRVSLAGSFFRTKESVEGIGYSPLGHALPAPLRLDLKQWDTLFTANDTVLGVHIPEGGNMTLEKCKAAFSQAVDFFKTHYPELNIKAICCSSWILWPYYEKALPDSNLAKFMRELYLFPVNSSGEDGAYFIFGRSDRNYAEFPRDNRMRRTMLDLLQNGKPLRSGSMFFLPEDLPFFGTQHYRR